MTSSYPSAIEKNGTFLILERHAVWYSCLDKTATYLACMGWMSAWVSCPHLPHYRLLIRPHCWAGRYRVAGPELQWSCPCGRVKRPREIPLSLPFLGSVGWAWHGAASFLCFPGCFFPIFVRQGGSPGLTLTLLGCRTLLGLLCGTVTLSLGPILLYNPQVVLSSLFSSTRGSVCIAYVKRPELIGI